MITKEQFNEYERIRLSGETNMFSINRIIILSGYILTSDAILDIMKNYKTYKNKYEVRNERTQI